MSFQNQVLLDFNDVTGALRHWKRPTVVDVIDLTGADNQLPTFEETPFIDLGDAGDCEHVDAGDIAATTLVSLEEPGIHVIDQPDSDFRASEVPKQPIAVVNSYISATPNGWPCNRCGLKSVYKHSIQTHVRRRYLLEGKRVYHLHAMEIDEECETCSRKFTNGGQYFRH